ncbi:T9SS type A sorting domain-containing protein [Candidatus Caldipriscus sp.]|nr:T9SS type A sorting domain-containing protein [Candidatus Caldipriscus sp.]
MKRVIWVLSGSFALGFWSEVFAESFGCPYFSPNPMSVKSFAKTYGGTSWDEVSSVQQTSDGGYILAGYTSSFGAGSYDIFFIKTDENGNISWTKTYGGAGGDFSYSVQQTSDGGYIVAGGTNSFGAGGLDIFLIKTDADGNIIWAKTYRGTGDEWARSVHQTSDGGYILAGATNSFSAGGYDILLIKADANGNIIWTKTYGGTNYEDAYFVQQTSDGGYIVVGATNSFGAGGHDIFLIKTDANGNIIWTKTYGGTNYDYAYSVQQTSDGGYIVAGLTTSFGASGYDIFLIKTDGNGNIIWTKTYRGTYEDGAYYVQQTSDGGYILAGYTSSFGAGGYDVFLIKTDANGNLQWTKTYGGTDDEQAYFVQQTFDGGYIVAGRTRSFGAGGWDAFLIKTDANGNIGSCSIVQDASPTETTPSPTVNTPYPSVSSLSFTVNSPSPTLTSPTLTVSEPCPLSISESCQIARGIIMPYKGGIKVRGSGEFEVKVYNVSGVMVKSVKGKDEVKLELSRGVYFVEVVSGGKVLRERVIIR